MKDFILKYKLKIILIFILFIAIFIRLFQWPVAISQVNCDEAMTAVNALSIVNNGTDTYGTSFPVYLEAWGIAGQSVILLYIMSFFIKLFGFSFITVRLPMLLISLISLFIFYDLLKRIFNSEKVALIGLAFLAICPWHIIQSIWSIDCNMFPHFMLISVYLLYRGIVDKKWLLYFSIFFFALSMYTYGVSVYVIPLFLLICAIYLLRIKKITIRQLFLCILIYFIFSLPIFTMYFLNFFHIDTNICIGPMTIQYFENNTRTSDMLFFSENIGNAFLQNIKSVLQTVFIGFDGLEWNSTPVFGTIYHISLIFFLLGIIIIFKEHFLVFLKNRKSKENVSNSTNHSNINIGIFLISTWLIFSFILGIIINNVNINRLNVIWYPIIFFITLGIWQFIERKPKSKYFIISIYLILFIGFSTYFYGYYTNKIDMSGCFSRQYIEAVHFASQTSSENKNIPIFYFNEKGDGALDVFTKFQAQIDNASITCINDRNTLSDNLNNSNVILLIHKEYVQDNLLLNTFDISNYHKTAFEDYFVIVPANI